MTADRIGRMTPPMTGVLAGVAVLFLLAIPSVASVNCPDLLVRAEQLLAQGDYAQLLNDSRVYHSLPRCADRERIYFHWFVAAWRSDQPRPELDNLLRLAFRHRHQAVADSLLDPEGRALVAERRAELDSIWSDERIRLGIGISTGAVMLTRVTPGDPVVRRSTTGDIAGSIEVVRDMRLREGLAWRSGLALQRDIFRVAQSAGSVTIEERLEVDWARVDNQLIRSTRLNDNTTLRLGFGVSAGVPLRKAYRLTGSGVILPAERSPEVATPTLDGLLSLAIRTRNSQVWSREAGMKAAIALRDVVLPDAGNPLRAIRVSVYAILIRR